MLWAYDSKDLVAILADRCSLCSRNHDLPSTGQKSSSGIKTDEYAAISHQNANLPSTAQVDDDDDFDPRGTAAKSMFWDSGPNLTIWFIHIFGNWKKRFFTVRTTASGNKIIIGGMMRTNGRFTTNVWYTFATARRKILIKRIIRKKEN